MNLLKSEFSLPFPWLMLATSGFGGEKKRRCKAVCETDVYCLLSSQTDMRSSNAGVESLGHLEAEMTKLML